MFFYPHQISVIFVFVFIIALTDSMREKTIRVSYIPVNIINRLLWWSSKDIPHYVSLEAYLLGKSFSFLGSLASNFKRLSFKWPKRQGIGYTKPSWVDVISFFLGELLIGMKQKKVSIKDFNIAR